MTYEHEQNAFLSSSYIAHFLNLAEIHCSCKPNLGKVLRNKLYNNIYENIFSISFVRRIQLFYFAAPPPKKKKTKKIHFLSGKGCPPPIADMCTRKKQLFDLLIHLICFVNFIIKYIRTFTLCLQRTCQ
jgi:hypothetical protein